MGYTTTLSANISFMQSQIQTAIATKSGSEWRHWTMVYTRFLCQCTNAPTMCDSAISRVRQILDDLLGPTVALDAEMTDVTPDESGPELWRPTIFGIKKRDFLRDDILPLLQKYVRLQRLYSEFYDQLL